MRRRRKYTRQVRQKSRFRPVAVGNSVSRAGGRRQYHTNEPGRELKDPELSIKHHGCIGKWRHGCQPTETLSPFLNSSVTWSVNREAARRDFALPAGQRRPPTDSPPTAASHRQVVDGALGTGRADHAYARSGCLSGLYSRIVTRDVARGSSNLALTHPQLAAGKRSRRADGINETSRPLCKTCQPGLSEVAGDNRVGRPGGRWSPPLVKARR
jgi:hypothetical protein